MDGKGWKETLGGGLRHGVKDKGNERWSFDLVL